jgi:hypothetical protein
MDIMAKDHFETTLASLFQIICDHMMVLYPTTTTGKPEFAMHFKRTTKVTKRMTAFFSETHSKGHAVDFCTAKDLCCALIIACTASKMAHDKKW